MSDQVIPESLINRVRKLLALAANNPSQAEADSATAKAQALMAEYNIEMSSVGEEAPKTADATREKRTTEIQASHEWQISLMAALAKNNFCHHWVTARRARREDGTGKERMRTKHNLIGRQANVAVVIEMYRYLVGTMDRLSAEAGYTDGRDRSTRSWYQGCVDRLTSRLDDQRRASEAESRARRADPARGSGTDLVLSDVYSSEEDLNNDLMHDYPPGTTAARSRESEARMEVLRAQWAAERAVSGPVVVARAEPPKPLTEKQRAKEEAKEQRWQDAYYRRQQKEAAKTDNHAYSSGSSAGRGIGLDKQVGADGPKKAIK